MHGDEMLDDEDSSDEEMDEPVVADGELDEHEDTVDTMSENELDTHLVAMDCARKRAIVKELLSHVSQ